MRRVSTALPCGRTLRIEQLESRWLLTADLVVDGIWTEPDTVIAGEEFRIMASVRNAGTTTADAGFFRNQEAVFFLDGEQQGEGDDYDGLDPAQSLVVQSPVLETTAGMHTIEVFADGNDEVAESNENNNRLSTSINVTAKLSWRDGPGIAAGIVYSATTGQSVYARVEGSAGEQLEVEVWEEDGSGDDRIDSFTITVGASGFGTHQWDAAWQGNDSDGPRNEYYLFYDVPFSISNTASELLSVSVAAGAGVNSYTNRLSYDWGGSGPGEGVIDVTLDRLDSTAPIDPAMQTWVVIHGRNGSFSEPTDRVKQLADDVVLAREDDQVITLNWSEGADSPLIIDFFGESWLVPVAQWTAEVLEAYGFTTSLVNLVGHSWGAVISGELAATLPGGVNTVLVIDPAEDAIPPLGTTYSTDNVIFGSDNSNHSWAFFTPGIAGNEETPTTADEAFVVADSEHSRVVDLVAAMIADPVDETSRFFSLDRLLAYAAGPWQLDQYAADGSPDSNSGYEAVISSTNNGTQAVGVEFVNKNAAPLPAAGDYDQDEDVDGADFLQWQLSFGTTSTNFLPADGNFTGTVESGDLTVWQANYTNALPLAASTQNVNLPQLFQVASRDSLLSSKPGKQRIGRAEIDVVLETYEPLPLSESVEQRASAQRESPSPTAERSPPKPKAYTRDFPSLTDEVFSNEFA